MHKDYDMACRHCEVSMYINNNGRLDNLLVRFSKTFLNLAQPLKLTQSLNIGLNWDKN